MQQRNGMNSLQVRRLTYSALFLAIALVLPFITGQIPEVGSALSPMHIPVLLCGFMAGWPWGAAVGFIAPLLRSVLFGMPAMFPNAVAMAFELAVYGLVCGLLYRALPKKTPYIYVSLIVAMIAGRIVSGLANVVLYAVGAKGGTYTLSAFLAAHFITAWPAIALHIVLIPILVLALQRAHIIKK
jgi:thiamine transporter ThiT